MSAAEDAEDYLRRHHPEQAELAQWVRSILLDAEPDLEQRVYRGWQAVGFHDAEAGYVCALFPSPERLLLTFEHGAALPDPEGVLIGNGKQVRSMLVAASDERTAGVIRQLLEQAIVHGIAIRA